MFELIDKWLTIRHNKRNESSSKKIARQASRAATRPGIHLDSMQAQRLSPEARRQAQNTLREALRKAHEKNG